MQTKKLKDYNLELNQLSLFYEEADNQFSWGSNLAPSQLLSLVKSALPAFTRF